MVMDYNVGKIREVSEQICKELIASRSRHHHFHTLCERIAEDLASDLVRIYSWIMDHAHSPTLADPEGDGCDCSARPEDLFGYIRDETLDQIIQRELDAYEEEDNNGN